MSEQSREQARELLLTQMSPAKLAQMQWAEIALEGDDHEPDLGFMARLLVQATMPHSNPGPSATLWSRQNGNLGVVMQAGAGMVKGRLQPLGLPYGSIPRLLLAWVTTEAVRTRSRDLELSRSLAEFMDKLDLNRAGGCRGDITRLRDQMRRLFGATITASYEHGKRGTADARFLIADKTMLFWDKRHPDQAGLWHSTVTLSEPFYNEIIRRPVPLDIDTLRALSRSPLALDLYMWLSYRACYLKRGTTVPWGVLEMQFGADYTRSRDFKAKFIKALAKIQHIYPAAAEPTEAGLVLKPGPTHIPRRLPTPEDNPPKIGG